MRQPRSSLRQRVEWARKGLRPWRQARKAAVKAYRDLRNFAQVARQAGTSRQWVRKWWHRFLAAGKSWSGLDDRSSRPHTLHTKRHAHETEVLALKDRYPAWGAKKLQAVGNIPLSHATIHRILREHGRVNESPKRQGRRSTTRFQRTRPNQLWQLDITQEDLHGGEGPTVWIATLLDDYSRFVLASRTYEEIPHEADMVELLRQAIHQWGQPDQVLTDRGVQFHTPSDVPRVISLLLHNTGIQHIMARPRHPQTLGKVERWHRSFKEECVDWMTPVASREGFREALHAFVETYNVVRPHEALEMVAPVRVFTEGYFPEHGLARFVNEVR